MSLYALCIYDTLIMLQALLCPSSGALDYMYAIAAYGVQCCKGEKFHIQALHQKGKLIPEQ